MIYYGKHSIDQSDIDAVVDVLKGNYLTQGPHIEEFEKSINELVGSKYSVAIMNWTAGIHIACEAAGLNSKNTLVTSPLTFCASSNGALYCQSTPVFADIDPSTLNIDPKKIDEACKKHGNVRVIMPVHFGGLACDMEEINKIAKKYGASVIEDAAHPIGGKYADGTMIGNCKYSEMVGFSFHPVKNIACGEGGVITTNNEGIYRKLLKLRSHGINKLDDQLIGEEALTDGMKNQWYHEMQILGYNYRMTDIQAALGNSQLKKLDRFLSRRIDIAERYEREFKGCENFKIPQLGFRQRSGNHLFVLRVNYEKLGKSRYEVIEELKQAGVQGHVHYLPVPMMPYYRENYPAKIEDYAEALAYYREALTIPLYPSMTEGEVQTVINAIKKIIG
jgi:UDP-4-amino-4,6-dideoxy-N-acetyl-beta-L-altrosamine transaminase